MPVFIPGNPLAPNIFFTENAVLFAVGVLKIRRDVKADRRLVQAPDRVIFQGGCAPTHTEVRRWACGAVECSRSGRAPSWLINEWNHGFAPALHAAP